MIFAAVIGWGSADPDLEQLKAQGVRALEMGYPYLSEKSEEEIAALNRKLQAHGLQIWSVHAPFGKNNNLSAPDESERIQALEIQKRLLPRVALLGAQVMVIHPSGGIPKEQRGAAAEALRKSLPEITRAAEEAGVRLGLENMLPEHLGDQADELMAYVEEIDSPTLGVCFDTGHAHCNHDMRGTFEVLKDRIVTFHLQDNDGSRDMHLQPGYGTIPWAEFMRIFETMSFSDPLVVEAAPWDGADLRTLLDEMELLFQHAEMLRPTRLGDRL